MDQVSAGTIGGLKCHERSLPTFALDTVWLILHWVYIEHDDGYGSSNHVKPDGRGNMGSLVTIKIIKMYCMAKKQVNNNYK